jgi:Leucine-rich repeat (LRR) protein
VDLDNRGAKDSDLAYVRAFPNLEELWLIGGNITDTGLAYLSETPALRELHLNQDNVTGPGIQVLGSLPRLRWLYLRAKSGSFSAADFQVIGMCKELEILKLPQTELPAGSLRFLKKLAHLKELDLSDASITDEHLDDIAECEAIEKLDLYGNSVTGKGLKKLSLLPRLSSLSLSKVQTVSDDDLKTLRECPQLKIIYIKGTKCTEQGVMNLIELPSLEVIGLDKELVTEKVKAVFQKDRPQVKFVES